MNINSQRLQGIKKGAVWFLAALTAALLFELFLFNFRWLQTRRYQPYEPAYTLGGAVTRQEDGRYWIGGGDAYIEMTGLNREVKNLYVGMWDTENKPLATEIQFTDRAHDHYFLMPELQTMRSIPKSLYASLQTAGESEKIRINLRHAENRLIEIEAIRLNVPVPFFFSWVRVLCVFGFLLLLGLLRPSSSLYRHRFSMTSVKQLTVIVLLAALNCGLFASLALSNPIATSPPWIHHYQYQMLAESLAEGKLYLKEEPPEELAAIANPYNPDARNTALEGTGKNYLWDAAYYQGKYYVYFGVVPELLFYLPYYLLSGQGFPTYVGVFLAGMAFVFGVFFLFRQIVRRWFPQTPFLAYLLVCLACINGSCVLWGMAQAVFYSLPIVLGLAFSVWGLCLWLMALNRLSPPQTLASSAVASKSAGLLLAGGSLCMALVAGCRPQMLVGSFLALPLFWDCVWKDRSLFSRAAWKRTVCFCLPIAAVAAGLMYYNAIRFGSPFDFGANYNLTTNDMTSRGFRIGRTAQGMYKFLFQPPVLGANFPFAEAVPFSSNYMGQTILEVMYGGAFACSPFLLSWTAAGYIRPQLKQKKLWGAVGLCGAAALMIVIADTQMAGILARYQMDFTWLLLLGAALVLLALCENVKTERGRRTFFLFLLAASAWTALYGLLAAVASLMQGNQSELFLYWKHLVQFWL